MKAVYVASPRSKKGNIFHIYNVVGTAQEIEDYKNSPNFKQYPSIGPNGEVQFITNYISMDDEATLVKKRDGNYTLDQGTFNKDVARLNAVAEASSVLADKFADRIADKLTSPTKTKRTVQVQFADEEETTNTPESLDNM